MGCGSVPNKKNYITLFGYPRDPVLKQKWTKAIQSWPDLTVTTSVDNIKLTFYGQIRGKK